MRVLIPLDGSDLAEYALEPTATIMRRSIRGSTMVLLRVLELTPTTLANFKPHYTQAVNQAMEIYSNYLREVSYRTSLEGICMDYRIATSMGSPVAAIVEQATDMHIDLIAMTSHGRSGLAHVFLGSVAEAVARESHIPTLIFHMDREEFSSNSEHQQFTILIPLDGSSFAERSIPMAMKLMHIFNGRLHLARIIPEDHTAAGEGAAATYLEHVHRYLVKEGCTVNHSIIIGDPARKILDMVQGADRLYDMIAMTTHSRTGLEHMRMGSVSEHILHHSKVPLLLVHPTGKH